MMAVSLGNVIHLANILHAMTKREDPLLRRLEELTRALDIQDAAKEMLFALSKDVFLVVNKDGNIKYVSPAFTDILGYNIKKEVLGQSWKTFLHPIEAGWDWESHHGETISRMQVSHVSKSGKWIIIDWNCAFEPMNGDWYCVGRSVGEVKPEDGVGYGRE
jgi:PAS domain-containing protein